MGMNDGPQVIRDVHHGDWEDDDDWDDPLPIPAAVDTELLAQQRGIFVAPEHTVVDASAEGVSIQVGPVRLLVADLMRAAFSDQKLVGGDVLPDYGDAVPLPEIAPVLTLPELALPDFGDEEAINALGNRLIPNYERELFGYEREMGDMVLPVIGEELKIPIINEFLTLPTIVDPIVRRVFMENEKQGPRLIAVSPDATPYPARIIIAEFPPTRVTALTRKDRHEIYTPYTVVVLSPNHGAMQLFCRNSPITPDDDHIYHFPFPHIGDGGGVCTGTIPGGTKQFKDMDPLAAASFMMTHYWQSGYNYFLTHTGINLLPKNIAEKATEAHGRSPDEFLRAWGETPFEEIMQFKFRDLGSVTQIAEKAMAAGMGARKHQMNWFLDERKIAAIDEQTKNGALNEAMIIDEYKEKLQTI